MVALSDSDGDTVQTYEYSVYGQVAASEPEFLTNPYMFTGRRFDLETGLYYYRARYYNPHIGWFMQTDPIGYGDGMNWYVYCRNNPLGLTDPSGCDILESAFGVVWDVVEGAVNVVNDVVTGAVNVVGGTAEAIGNAVQYILDDIASHQEVAFYVIGPNGIRLPVKVFENRHRDAGIPFISGYAINIGGEIHIGPDMAADLMKGQNIRDSQGIDLELEGWPIMDSDYSQYEPHYSFSVNRSEELMAHEIGHQVDADNLGPVLYQLAGLIFTHDQEGWFEQNAWNRGEYYGIDWNYNP